MYERGEYVVYRRTEVCRVADVAGLRNAGRAAYTITCAR